MSIRAVSLSILCLALGFVGLTSADPPWGSWSWTPFPAVDHPDCTAIAGNAPRYSPGPGPTVRLRGGVDCSPALPVGSSGAASLMLTLPPDLCADGLVPTDLVGQSAAPASPAVSSRIFALASSCSILVVPSSHASSQVYFDGWEIVTSP